MNSKWYIRVVTLELVSFLRVNIKWNELTVYREEFLLEEELI